MAGHCFLYRQESFYPLAFEGSSSTFYSILAELSCSYLNLILLGKGSAVVDRIGWHLMHP